MKLNSEEIIQNQQRDMNEQQGHLENLFEQQKNIVNELKELERVMISKREMALKIQGAIEYLQQVGITLPEEPKPEEVEEPKPEEVEE